MDPIKLYDVKSPEDSVLESYSPFAVKVHRALKFLEIPYDKQIVRGPRRSPSGQVPAITYQGTLISDSSQILRKLLSLDATKNLRTDSVAWELEDYSDRDLFAIVFGSRFLDDENFKLLKENFFGYMPRLKRDFVAHGVRRAAIKRLKSFGCLGKGKDEFWSWVKNTLDELESRAPTHGYWTGSELSVGDLGIYGQLQSLRSGLSPKQEAWLNSRVNLVSYLNRVKVATNGTH